MSQNVSPNNQPGLTAQNELTTQNEFIQSFNQALNVNIVGGGGGGGDVNLTEIDGNPISVDTGNSDIGTQRVVIADDQPPIQTLEQTGLVPYEFDYIGADYPDAVTAVYDYHQGGSGGTLVATVTVVYTDSSQENISTVTRT